MPVEKARWKLHTNSTLNKTWKQKLNCYLPPIAKNSQIRRTEMLRTAGEVLIKSKATLSYGHAVTFNCGQILVGRA